MSDLKDKSIKEVIDREGGEKYTDRSADRGGPTRFGVTQAKARENGYTGDMRNFTYAQAYAIYAKDFWDKMRCSEIEALCPALAVWMFDYGVNSGTGNAAKTLQGLLNVLNNRQKLYKDIPEGGLVGTMTMDTLKAFAKVRGAEGVKYLSYAFNSLRVSKLYTIAHNDESQEENFYGWLVRVVSITKQVGL